jgi:hypothetical protein
MGHICGMRIKYPIDSGLLYGMRKFAVILSKYAKLMRKLMRKFAMAYFFLGSDVKM